MSSHIPDRPITGGEDPNKNGIVTQGLAVMGHKACTHRHKLLVMIYTTMQALCLVNTSQRKTAAAYTGLDRQLKSADEKTQNPAGVRHLLQRAKLLPVPLQALSPA